MSSAAPTIDLAPDTWRLPGLTVQVATNAVARSHLTFDPAAGSSTTTFDLELTLAT